LAFFPKVSKESSLKYSWIPVPLPVFLIRERFAVLLFPFSLRLPHVNGDFYVRHAIFRFQLQDELFPFPPPHPIHFRGKPSELWMRIVDFSPVEGHWILVSLTFRGLLLSAGKPTFLYLSPGGVD